jgi:DNA-binding CsgD family transcriptional regulator
MSVANKQLPALLDLKEKKTLTELKVDQRVEEIMLMVTHGISTTRIVKDIREKYNVSRNTADSYLAKAMMELAAHTRTYSVDTWVAKRRSQLEAILEACMIEKDYKTALAAIGKLVELDVPPNAQQHSVTVTTRHAALSPEEKSERLRMLLNERQKFIDATYTVEDEEKHKEVYEQAKEEFGYTDEGVS